MNLNVAQRTSYCHLSRQWAYLNYTYNTNQMYVLLTYMYYVLCDVVRYVASCLLSAATKETFRRQMLCLKVRGS